MHWQRTFLHPMLANFDAPSRDECAADRITSNSPQQALTLLNDPVFVEAAQSFARNLLAALPDGDFETHLSLGFQRAMAREPQPSETQALRAFYHEQLAYYQANPQEAKLFFGEQLPDSNANELATPAALAQVCRVILNLHETITRY